MQEFHYPIEVENLDDAGTAVSFAADEAARAGLAAQLGLEALDQFEVEAQVLPKTDGSVAVAGTIRAALVQRCVVSLERVESAIEEPFAVLYVLAEAADGQTDVEVEPSDEDVEAYDGATIDLGATAREYLALAIDPYPRKLGVEYQADGTATTADSPFAVLAKLRNNV